MTKGLELSCPVPGRGKELGSVQESSYSLHSAKI